MTSSLQLKQLNKLIQFTIFFILFIVGSAFAATVEDIWKKNENQNNEAAEINKEKKITIESPIVSDKIKKISIKIEEQSVGEFDQTVIGIFDPEINNFNLNMWSESDGEDVKKILKRINKLKLSKFSEDLMFKVLFTNAYSPKKNLTSEEFLKIKIDWLIKNKRLRDLETLLMLNPVAGKEKKVIKLLVNEYLSSSDIRSACEKMNSLSKDAQSDYLNKFLIYCLIHQDRKDEAQLILELLKERSFKDNFFDDKINFLLGLKENTSQKIKDDNLLNFYLSHITAKNFSYKPNEKTDKYIWRYLSSANLIKTTDFDNEEVILAYEKAAAENSIESDEIFKIYKQMLFSVDQLINAKEIYKNLPNFKARALIYQSILLSDVIEKKLYLAFLLKNLFEKDNISNAYSKELLSILNNIDSKEIPDSYENLVTQVLEKGILISKKKIKFDNDVLHRSKVLKHFLDNQNKTIRTEKDLKSVYKKIKKNKKYFVSIKDIIVLESLAFDGISLPRDLDFTNLSAQLTIPKNLEKLVNQNQMGLVVLKIIEIIGEDKIHDLDPETIYFLNNILNQLNLKRIRNHILSEALPARV